jgi:hypothetical protein
VLTACGSASNRSGVLLVRLNGVGMMRSFEALNIPETCLKERANKVGETSEHMRVSNKLVMRETTLTKQ